jgi:hypothetical protein
MSRKEVFVIRIGVSIESVAETTIETTPSEQAPNVMVPGEPKPPEQRSHTSNAAWQPPRFRGRDNRPTEAFEGDRRAMSDAQKKALFRLAYTFGDREGALTRVLQALGVERLEWATRADASRAIDAMKAKTSNGSSRPSNGASHD